MYKILGVWQLSASFCPASAFVTADSDEARNPQHFIHVTVRQHNKEQENRSINFKLKSNEENFNGNCDCYNCI